MPRAQAVRIPVVGRISRGSISSCLWAAFDVASWVFAALKIAKFAKAVKDAIKLWKEFNKGRKQAGKVKVVNDAAELPALFDEWTAGAKRLPARGPKIPEVFQLQDGTVVQWREASKSGGETIDIFEPGAQDKKVHIKP